MKQQIIIAGRLSFGSYMELVGIMAVAANTLGLFTCVFSGAGFEEGAVGFISGITFFLLIGLVTFPVYASNLLRKSPTLTIVQKDQEQPKE